MKKVLPFLFVFFLACIAAAQTPQAVEAELLSVLGRISDSGSYLGNYDETKNEHANAELRSLLVRIGNRQDILRYAFAGLKEDMWVATSPDGKFRIYSWDRSIGGTMHFFDCVLQYQAANGRVFAQTCSSKDEGDIGGSYFRIFEVSSRTGTVYLANATSIADGTTHGQSIEAFRIVGAKMDTAPKVIRTRSGITNLISFAYSPFTLEKVSESELVSFDPDKKSFWFPVVIDDGKSGGGKVTDKFITYKFNGRYFEKTK